MFTEERIEILLSQTFRRKEAELEMYLERWQEQRLAEHELEALARFARTGSYQE